MLGGAFTPVVQSEKHEVTARLNHVDVVNHRKESFDHHKFESGCDIK